MSATPENWTVQDYLNVGTIPHVVIGEYFDEIMAGLFDRPKQERSVMVTRDGTAAATLSAFTMRDIVENIAAAGIVTAEDLAQADRDLAEGKFFFPEEIADDDAEPLLETNGVEDLPEDEKDSLFSFGQSDPADDLEAEMQVREAVILYEVISAAELRGNITTVLDTLQDGERKSVLITRNGKAIGSLALITSNNSADGSLTGGVWAEGEIPPDSDNEN